MTESKNLWYRLQDEAQIDTPALIVYPNRVKQNIETALSMVGDAARLRPHVKTHKCREVTQLMLDAGITQFKCATIAEAEMLGSCKAPDVLLAYQPNGPKLKRLMLVIQQYSHTQYGCLVDNEKTALELSAAFSAAGRQIPVYIDLNVGMNRTGIAPGVAALRLYSLCQSLPGLCIMGLHAYDGHIRQPVLADKIKACNEAFEKVIALENDIIQADLPQPAIIMGGSPSFSVHCQRPRVICSPGTFVYWDYTYSTLCPEQAFLHAAVLLTRVISLPTPTRICIDLGHKSVAAENDISRRVHFLHHPQLTPVAQSEEHLVVEAPEGHGFSVGQLLYALPYHVCPTVALYEKVLTATNHHLTGEWQTVARNRSISC